MDDDLGPGAPAGSTGSAERAISDIESRIDALADSVGALRRALPSADVATHLTAQVDALPDTLAARLGIEAWTAALGMRIGGLTSAVEQVRLATHAAAEQTKERIDDPPWLRQLHAALEADDGEPTWLPPLLERIESAADRSWLSALLQLVVRLEDQVEKAATADPPAALVERLDVIASAITDLAPVLSGQDTLLGRLDLVDAKLGDLGDLDTLGTAQTAAAERLGIEASTAALGVRIGGLASAVEQVRLATHAAAEQTKERIDDPPWLGQLHAALEADDGEPTWLPPLLERIESAADRSWLSALLQLVVRLEDQVEKAATADPPAALVERLDVIASAITDLAPVLSGQDTLLGRLDLVDAKLGDLGDLDTLGTAQTTAAERLGIEASTAALGVRIGGLASAVEQVRLATHAAAEQTKERIDDPPWLGQLHAALEADDGEPAWLPPLLERIESAADRSWLSALLQLVVRLEDQVEKAATADPPAALVERLDVIASAITDLAPVLSGQDTLLGRLDLVDAKLGDLGDLDTLGTAQTTAAERLDALADSVGALRSELPSAEVATHLTAQVDALPDTLAARLGIEASTAALGMRIGGLASAVEQVRLATHAAAEQTKERIDDPPWLGQLHAALEADDGEPAWLPPLLERIESAADRSWLSALLQLVVRLEDQVEKAATADPPAALVERLDVIASAITTAQAGAVGRFDTIEKSVLRLDTVSAGQEAIAERLRAIDSALDPVAGIDEAAATLRGLVEGHDRLEQRLAAFDVVLGGIAELRSVADGTGAAVSTLAQVVAEQPDPGERLDRLATTQAEIVGQLPILNAVQERIESVGAAISAAASRLDGIETAVHGIDVVAAGQRDTNASLAEVRLATDGLASSHAALAERLGTIEEAIAAAIVGVAAAQNDASDRLTDLRRTHDDGARQTAALIAHAGEVQQGLAERVMAVESAGQVGFDAVLERIDEHGPRMEEVAIHVAALAAALDGTRSATASLSSRLDSLIGATTGATTDDLLLEELRALSGTVDRVLAAAGGESQADALQAVHDQLADLAVLTDVPHRLNDLATAISTGGVAPLQPEELERAIGQLVEAAEHLAPGPSAVSMTAVFDRMEQRDRSLAARLDRLLDAATAADAVASPGAEASAIDGLAAAIDDLAELVTATAERMDERLTALTETLGGLETRVGGLEASAAEAPTAENKATLALLRAERARVRAQLDEERSLLGD